MCFSPEMDAVAGLVVTGIGVDALRHVTRPRQVPLAALPVLFGVHQFIETFVWLELQGRACGSAGGVAAWFYLLIALVVVPVAIPFAFWRLGEARWPGADKVFLAAGVLAAAINGHAFFSDSGRREIEGHQISYYLDLPYDGLAMSAYVVATCGPALVTRSARLRAFGVLNLVAVGALVALNQSGVISLWCLWAALTSVLINLHLRRSRTRQGSSPVSLP